MSNERKLVRFDLAPNLLTLRGMVAIVSVCAAALVFSTVSAVSLAMALQSDGGLSGVVFLVVWMFVFGGT